MTEKIKMNILLTKEMSDKIDRIAEVKKIKKPAALRYCLEEYFLMQATVANMEEGDRNKFIFQRIITQQKIEAEEQGE